MTTEHADPLHQQMQVQRKLVDLRDERDTLARRVLQLEKDLAFRQNEVDELGRNASVLRRKVDRLEAISGPDSEGLRGWQEALDEEEARLKVERGEVKRALDNLQQREQKVAAREETLNRIRGELSGLGLDPRNLESLPAELRKWRLAAESLHADKRKLEVALEAVEQVEERKSHEVVELSTKVSQVTQKLDLLQKRYRSLRVECADATGQRNHALATLESTSRELARVRARAQRLRVERNEARQLLSAYPDLGVRSEALLNWLVQEAEPERIGLDDDAMLGWTGIGSYDADAFDRMLLGLGVKQYQIPHPAISYVVVGRTGWSREDLEMQIEMREGNSLRIYSQEMLLAALVVGRDPLDCESSEVFDSFMHGHSALEFLAHSDLRWPEYSAVDTSTIDEVGEETVGVTESPLHALGYRVGETSSLFESERRQILGDALQMRDLPWVKSDVYMRKWGSARSHQRLYRIAFHLAMLANGLVGRDWRKPQARRDWISDLKWLHREYYLKKRFRFTWPDIAVK